MARRTQVFKALEFEEPDYLPLLYFNGDRSNSDIVFVDIVEHFGGRDSDVSEWGFAWEKMDGTMGQPKAAVLNTLDDLGKLTVPDTGGERRFRDVGATMLRFGKDRFYIASLGLSGFTVMAALRGFKSTLIELYTDADRIAGLADIVFDFEERVILRAGDYDFDAVAFFDDWGMQTGMIISPAMWRSFFKERYRRQFDLAHRLGMKVYFHSCGYYYDIIQDLVDSGVDFLNISQPNLYDIERLAADFGGKVCFVFPVSYQTTSITGTRNEIFDFVRDLIVSFDARRGGVVGYLEEYESIGMSPANYQACEEAFRIFGAFAR